MTKNYYPELDETLYTQVLENGLTVAVVPRINGTYSYSFSLGVWDVYYTN